MQSVYGRSRETSLLVAAVETSPGSGVFEVDDRLRVEAVTLDSDEHISTARLSVRIDESFDTAAARRVYSPDLRVVIRTDEAEASGNVVLFEGYPPVQEARWEGGPGGGAESFGFVARHVYERLSRDRRGWIYGRHMRSGAIEDGVAADPGTWAGRSVLVEALPCVFNLDGAPNCAATPLSVTAPDGSSRSIHVFTYDDDPNGIPWTLANALRYLVWFYAPREGPVFEGNVFDATDAFVQLTSESAVGATTQLIRRLLGAPESLTVEATNVVEALALLADVAGVHVSVDTVAAGAGVRSQLRVWAPGDGTSRRLNLARGGRHGDGTLRYDASALSASDVFRANQIRSADLRWDYQRIVNAPIVVGDVKGHEMTVPLVPGWLPTLDLDNVNQPDRVLAKERALTPDQVARLGDAVEQSAWFRHHHREGSEFAQNRYAGRRWVLNEDGRFAGATYNRNAPFDDYQPFDFSTVTGSDTTVRGAWSRRSRPLLPTITRDELGARFGVFVEVSFDGGANWYRPKGPIAVLRNPTGCVFEVTNPLEITPPGVDPLEQNMWYAVIDQMFRVRVTAVIEGDERLLARPAPSDSNSPTLQTTSQILYRPQVYKFVTRQGTTNVLAAVNPGATDVDRDDSAAIEQVARDLASRLQDRRVIASPAVPWLDTDFGIGDQITAIRGRGVSLVTRQDEASMGPSVVGKRYRFNGGRWETVLMLEHAGEPFGSL
ncbi:MAG: hypothetical protein V3W34_00915 [Phycisphaerae bacterium]